MTFGRPAAPLATLPLALLLTLAACDAGTTTGSTGSPGAGGAGSVTSTSSSQGGSTGAFMGSGGNNTCAGSCSPDLHSVLDCSGNVVATCTGDQGCNPSTLTCANACQNATDTKQSIGCEYFATDMEQNNSGACFAAYIANTWNTPVKIEVAFGGQTLPIASFARIPSGQGAGLTYAAYDAATGLPPGEVAILFLSQGSFSGVTCPTAPALDDAAASIAGTGIGGSFRITTDRPVVAYEMNPYGGGNAAVTAASLLLPTSAWDTNYIGVTVTPQDIANPSMNIIAAQDNTQVQILPTVAVSGGSGIPAGPANTSLTFTLNAGQQAQLSQPQDLTGSIIQSDKPIGLMAGQACMRMPTGTAYCDHGEQMIPPIRALGSEYVGVMHRPRNIEPAFWRVIGAVDGTVLTWSSPVGGPATIDQGSQVIFSSATPFSVKSQDADHPFMLFSYMTGSTYTGAIANYGDPDMVIGVPVQQYLNKYIFFTDPTYPETNLVVVRAKQGGAFKDVTLDCAGVLGGWQAVGDYEWTRTDLVTGNFQNQGSCSNGRHEMSSDGPFGLWVWGWGTTLTSPSTQNVSYGYPAGMNVIPINEVVIPPIPQ